MRIAALFAGIGGLERGLEEAGHETRLACEVWEPARAVLRERALAQLLHDDVRTLQALPRSVQLLSAGFPCQDLSQAGQTAGIGGAKSGLVEHVFRLLDDRPVPHVLLENVSFMLKLGRGAAMERLACAFEQRGYRWAYRTIDTLSFLPQRRERVFFLASAGRLDPADVLFVDEAVPAPSDTALTTHAHGFYWTEGTRGLGWAADAVPTLKNGSTIGIPSPPAILLPSGAIVTPDIRDAERLQGFPEDWTASAPARQRWSLVGNAVSVPVARWIGERLRAPGQYRGGKDRDWPAGPGPFPPAGRFDGRTRHAVAIGTHPVWRARAPLHLFLRHPGAPLSLRATVGFLTRARASTLRFVPGFLEAVARHALHMQGPGAMPQPHAGVTEGPLAPRRARASTRVRPARA
jgi:DNA (cytosine-5)-methyltransferase 1